MCEQCTYINLKHTFINIAINDISRLYFTIITKSKVGIAICGTVMFVPSFRVKFLPIPKIHEIE